MLLITQIFKWVLSHWKGVAIAVGAVFVIVLISLVFRSCNKPPKLNQQEIIKAQQAIAENDAKKMKEVLVASDVKEKVADQTQSNSEANTVNAIQESKEKWKDASIEEMRAELERRANQ